MSELFVNSLEKAFKVIRAFDEHHRQLSLSNVADRAGISIGSAQRFLHTLQTLGYIRRDEATRLFALSPKILRLGYLYLQGDTLIERAMPYLRDLNQATRETVTLTELDDLDIIYVIRFTGHHSLSARFALDSPLPAYCTAPGRAILSKMSDPDMLDIIRRSNIQPLTPNTILDRDRILTEIRNIRNTGYAITDQECLFGDISISSPILNLEGTPIGAVNLAVPAVRYPASEAEEEFGNRVIETAHNISG